MSNIQQMNLIGFYYHGYVPLHIISSYGFTATSRPPQDVGVLAVLDFQIPCFRPESPALNPSSLLTNQEAHERNLRDDFKDGK